MQNVLDRIVERKRRDIEEAQRRRPGAQLREQLADAPPVRDFTGALCSAPDMALIAEIKKASPSAGLIREDFDPVRIAGIYERHGAGCISVLTDESFFQGHLDHLREVRRAVSVPLLRKDFILDRYQILEARVAGADCILLIAECLSEAQLNDLHAYAAELGMQTLIELYEPENLERVLSLQPPLLGINNRNLRTFETDLEHVIRLAGRVPESCLLISESGLRNREDVLRLQRAGIRAVLVGETLLRSPDIGAKVEELLGNRGAE